MADEPIEFMGRIGATPSPEHEKIVRETAGKILLMLNEVGGAYTPDILGTVLLSSFMSQTDPVHAFNLITQNVASGIRQILTPVQGNA
ncbi:MAG TPA: hypothetical protein VNU68_35045 [Verrucomicrobiae bacterium]|nr:hypothetical protein [Verrucomicrobiae bacterium]